MSAVDCLSNYHVAILSPGLLPVAELLFPTPMDHASYTTGHIRSFRAEKNMEFWPFSLVHPILTSTYQLNLHLNISFGEVVFVYYLEYTLLEYFLGVLPL